MSTKFRERYMAWCDGIWLDARSAVRPLLTAPSRSAAIIGVLGLAIGLTTATFTLVDALFVRPVPFSEPDELAILRMRGKVGGPTVVPPTIFNAWKRSAVFEHVEAARERVAFVETDSGLVKRPLSLVTPGVFELLGGVRPMRGRLFDRGEGVPGTDDRVLISAGDWRTYFKGDPALIGRRIQVDGRPATVIGILPPDFHFPHRRTAIWQVSDFSRVESPRDLPVVYVRFRPDVPKPDALRVATEEARKADAQYAERWADAMPLATGGKQYRRAVFLLAGGVILSFLALCANASSLLIVGFIARSREFETRLALGASRGRLVRLAVFESAIACGGGVLVGASIGWALIAVARVVVPRGVVMDSLSSLDIDGRALVVTSVSAVIALLTAGVLPAVMGTRVQARLSPQLATRAGTQTRGTNIAKRALLVCQLAVSCMLLLGATLLVRSFVNLTSQERGIDPSGILVATVVLPEGGSASANERTRIAEMARTFPGISHTSWSYGVPPAGGVRPSGTWTSDRPGAPGINMEVRQFAVDLEFLALYEVPLVQGREFAPSDGPDTVLISESFARALWPDGRAAGRSLTFYNERLKTHRRLRVSGVVKDIRYPSLDRTLDVPQIYEPLKNVGRLFFLSVRCDTTCPEPALVHQRLAGSGADIETVTSLEPRYAAQVAGPRAAAVLALVFAVTALVAAVMGLFSLLSQSVAGRLHEFGIRMALGALPSAIRRLVWRESLTVVVPGLGVGVVGALVLAQMLSSYLFEVADNDLWSWLAVTLVLIATVAVASWHPTRTALRSNPLTLLKEE